MTRFSKDSVLRNVETFKCIGERLLVFRDGTLLDGADHVAKIDSRSPATTILHRNDIYYLSFSDGTVFAISMVGDVAKLPRTWSLGIMAGSYLHEVRFSSETCETSNFLVDMDLETEVVEFPDARTILFARKNFYFKENSHNLKILSLLSGSSSSIKTDFDLTNSKLLGVAHNHLFVLTKGNRIIVLNVDDGSLIKTFEWTEPVDGTTYLPGLSETFLNAEDQCIYCLGNFLIKIDTQNLEILTCRHVSTSFDAMAEITVKNSSHQGRYISFTGWRDEYAGRGRVIGLFDIESEEFVWTEELSQFIPAFHTPQLCKDKLYILDIENTLHIFKRTEPA